MSGFLPHYHFLHTTIMKLHLPKGLRSALLAVCAVAYPASSLQAAEATYDYLLKTNSTYTVLADGTAKTPLTLPSTQSSWIVDVAARAFPGEGTDGSYIGSVIVGNVEVPREFSHAGKNASSEKVPFPPNTTESSFAVYYTETWQQLFLITPSGVTKLGQLVNPSGGEYSPVERVPFQVTLQWVANGDGTGSLYYTGATRVEWTYIPKPDSYDYAGATVVPTNGDMFKQGKITILENVALPDDFFTTSANTTGDSEFVITSYARGGEGDPAGWQITGTADLAKLQGSGAETYQDATGGSHNTLQAEDVVHFVGNEGVIYATENAVYSNDTIAEADVLNGGNTCSIGFGAAAGKTLTVEQDALNGQETDGRSAGGVLNGTALRIVGAGTVKLELADSYRPTISNLTMQENTTLELNTSADKNVTVSLNAGTVSNGSITRTGAGDLVLRFDAAGKDAALKAIASTATDSNIIIEKTTEGSGALKAASIANTYGDIEVYVPTAVAGDIEAEAGSIIIDGLSVVSAANLNAGADINIGYKSQVTAGGSVTAAGDVEVASNAVLIADTIEAQSVTAVGKVNTRSIEADSVTAKDITISGAASGALLGGGVIIDGGSVTAGVIGDDAQIAFAADGKGTVSTSNMKDADIVVDGVTVLGNAAVAGSSVVISSGKIAAAGTLTAESVDIQDGYTIVAKELQAGSIAAGDTWIQSRPGDVAVLKDVAELTDSAATVGSITADTIELGEGYTLNNAVVSTTNGIEVGDGATLNNVTIARGSFTNAEKVYLNNVAFSGGSSFGGYDGAAIVVDPNGEGVDNVQINGVLTGDALNISSMVLNAEALQFGYATTTYDILVGDELSYDPQTSNYTLNIESFVRAELSYDAATGTVSISGYKDEEGIKTELTTTPNRQAAMSSLTEAVAHGEPGTPLADINEYIGHVNRYSLAERQEVLDAVSGASLVVLADVQRRGLRDSQRNIRNRVIQMGGGTSAGLTTDWEYVGLQTWAQADASFTSTGGNQDECGYDFNTTGATVGANIDLTANLVVGMAFSASYGDVDVDSKDYATVDTSSYYLNFFGRYQSNRWVHMFIFTVGMDEMDTERRVMGYKANGNTEGTTYSLYYELGYTIGLDYENKHILQPLASVTLTTAQMSSFVERGSIGNAGLRYEGEDFVYGQLAIGARYQGVIYESVHERCAVLETRAVITHDIGDKTDHATLAYSGGHNFSVKGADSTGIGFEIGAGISIPVEQHTTLFADADFTYAPEYTGFRANVGVRYDF